MIKEGNPYVLSNGERRSWREVGHDLRNDPCILAEALQLSARPLRRDQNPFLPATGLYLHIHGGHAFSASDPLTKAKIARMTTTKPALRPDVVPKVISKSDAPPASEWYEWDSDAPTIISGHFVVGDFLALRLELHSKSICPKVQLNSKGIPKALRVR